MDIHQAMLALQPHPDAVPVIDPCLRHLGVLWVDLAEVEATRGLQRHQEDPGGCRRLSVCQLHQTGRCQQAGRCNQLHVRRSHMVALRAILPRATDCCEHHRQLAAALAPPGPHAAAPRDRGPLHARHGSIVVRWGDRTCLPVPAPDRILATAYWTVHAFRRILLLPEPGSDDDDDNAATPPGLTLFVPANRICKLHQEHRCTFGADCNNAHVCRVMWTEMMEARRQQRERSLSPVSWLLEGLLLKQAPPPAPGSDDDDDVPDPRPRRQRSRLREWKRCVAATESSH